MQEEPQNSPDLNKPGAGGARLRSHWPQCSRVEASSPGPAEGRLLPPGRAEDCRVRPSLHSSPSPPNIASRAVHSEQTPEQRWSEQVGGGAQPGEMEPGSTPA